MLQLLRDILWRFQWPKVRKEIRRLFPETLELVKKMEAELYRVVTEEIGHGAYGVSIACLTREMSVYVNELKIGMEGYARVSLELPCSEKIKNYIGADRTDFSLADAVADLEDLSRNLIFKIDCQECVLWPVVTRKPSFFISDAISDPWFVGSTLQTLKMSETY